MSTREIKSQPGTDTDKTGGVKPVRAFATVRRNLAQELGYEWYLELNENEQVVPVNLKDPFRVPNIAVDVAYIPASKRALGKGIQTFVEIVSIRLAKQ